MHGYYAAPATTQLGDDSYTWYDPTTGDYDPACTTTDPTAAFGNELFFTAVLSVG